jgi:soluble lytic murein transglycosylase-like protein
MKASDRYDSLFRFYAEEAGFNSSDWLWFKAQVRAESAFDTRAVSPVGAKGLGQFMNPTWVEWGKGHDPFNPEANIDAQIRYMKWLLARVTTWDLAFAAYNWGIGNVLKVWQDPQWKQRLPLETKEYLARINKYHEEYQ